MSLGIKLGFNIHQFAKMTKQHLANIPLKDGSSVKLLFPAKGMNDGTYTAIRIKHGHVLEMKGYKGESLEEIAAFQESLKKFAAKGVNVEDEYTKALFSPYGGY
jgi:hypothetical protein